MAFRRAFDRLLCTLAAGHAGRLVRGFERSIRRADAVQDALLARLIRENAASTFGRDHGFGDARGYDDFSARVPIRKYDALHSYLDQVYQGKSNALFGDGRRVVMFALTSGTTAQAKYIPITPQALAQWRRGWNVWGLKALLDHPGTMLRAIVQVTSPMNDHLSPGGMPCGAITGLLAATQKRLVRRYYVAPIEVADIRDTMAKYYTIMRMLIPHDAAFMVTANPATLLHMARLADAERAPLIQDIRDGTLRSDLSIPDSVRRAVAARLAPDAAAARRLESLSENHGGLFPRHYWRLGFRAHWIGGTMGLYESQFPKYFGDVPVRDVGLLASEGRMSIPLNDGTPSGVLAVESQFFEFIPADEYGAERPTVLRSRDVIVGGEYYLVVTNDSGLYRYDLGDRVRVTGQLGEAPLIEFLSRDAHTASLAGEKLTENQVVLAMERVRRATGMTAMTDFIVAPAWDDPPFYRLHVDDTASGGRLDDLAARMDRALSETNGEYRSRRESHRLGPVRLVRLPVGTLSRRNDGLRAARARTAEQFKQQYLMARPGDDGELVDAAGCLNGAPPHTVAS